MCDGEAAQDLAALIEETGVVVRVSPINAKKDLRSASFPKREAEVLSADAVRVLVLEPSRGRPLWTVTPGQPGETVRRERSKRSASACNAGLGHAFNPRTEKPSLRCSRPRLCNQKQVMDVTYRSVWHLLYWSSMMLRLLEPAPRYEPAILDAVHEMQAIGDVEYLLLSGIISNEEV